MSFDEVLILAMLHFATAFYHNLQQMQEWIYGEQSGGSFSAVQLGELNSSQLGLSFERHAPIHIQPAAGILEAECLLSTRWG